MTDNGEKYLKMRCPECGVNIEFPARGLGERVMCPRCGVDVKLSRRILYRSWKVFCWVFAVWMVIGLILSACGEDMGAAGILMAVVLGTIYFLPTWVARHKRAASSICVINLFLGWTLVGWVAALAWAMYPEKETA